MKTVDDPLVLSSGIDGLDIDTGLRRVLGKKPLYLSMLRMFVDGQKPAVMEIRQALEDQDWETAERLAHTLKGIAGSIAATALQALAVTLNDAIRQRLPRKLIDERLDELGISLNDLISQLEQKLPKVPEAGSAHIESFDNDRERIG